MLFTYIIIFIFFVFLAIIILYVLHIYVFPKKLEEIARMIESGQTKLAIKKLNELIEKDDRNSYAHFLLAEAHMKDNNLKYAIVEYRQVLKLNRFDEKMKESYVRSRLARLYRDRKALDEAKKEYLILTKIDPDNFENFFELGRIFYDLNIMDKAMMYFKNSVAKNPNHDLSYYHLGQIYYRNGLHSDAKQAFLNTIKIDPSNHRAHYFLGLVLRQMGDYEWAIKEFEVAQKSDELKVKSLLAKGTCYIERGQHPKAIQELERGLKFARKGSEVELSLRYFLAECHEKMRDIHAAIRNWERIVEVNTNFRDVQEKLNSYAEFRQDDRIKDFLIAGLSQFEHLSRKIVEAMGNRIMDVDIISDTEIEIIATESDGKWRNTRQTNRIVRIIRTTDTIQESLLRKLHEKMRSKNAMRIIIITTGDYSQPAMEFANTRPIELYGKSDLISMLRKT